MKNEGRLGHESRSTSQSVTSLDREDRDTNQTQQDDKSPLHEEAPSEASIKLPTPAQSPQPQSPLPSLSQHPPPQPSPPLPVSKSQPCDRLLTPEPKQDFTTNLRSDTPDTDDDVGCDIPLPPHLSAPVISDTPKDKSAPEIVMDVVRAAEQLTSHPPSQNSAILPSSPLDRKTSAETKTTKVVLSKHTLAPQTSTPIASGRASTNGGDLSLSASPVPPFSSPHIPTPLPTNVHEGSTEDLVESRAFGLGLTNEKISRVKQTEETLKDSPKKMTLKDRMKFFEEEMKKDKAGPPKENRKFSFLSQDEVAKMKEDEDRRVANMTPEQLANLSRLEDVEEMADDLAQQFGVNSDFDHRKYNDHDIMEGLVDNSDKENTIRSNNESGIVRTAKAERRAQSREGQVNEEDQLSPADRRRAEAEKRAAWRQARLKSLENDALQAQYVIEKYSELSDTANDNTKNDNSINNYNIVDEENNMPVETCRETLMTLSLTDAENANLNSKEMITSITTGPSIEIKEEEESGTINMDQFISGEKVDDSRGNVKEHESIDCNVDTVENLTDDQPHDGGIAISTDNSDHEVCTPLPQTPTSPDENANSRC
ncbi:protein lap4-like isoform X6 [Homarus americanus]|uniref:protein lap4-like isoform X6 n=1 Tax=Homarus americanus TaxID=6706 RepID=UPI001C45CFF3|nr:protein lap4-like isoform X6 [Homarus americanus]